MGRSRVDARAPERSSDLVTVQYIVVAMCLAGGLIPAITLAAEPTDRATSIGCGIVAVAMALTALLVWFARPPRQRALELVAQWVTLLTGGSIASMPTVGIMPVYLLWPVVLVAYFSSIQVLVLTYLWSMSVLTVATILNPPAFGFVDVLIGMGGTLAIMAGGVWTSTQRQRGLRQEFELAARTDPLTALRTQSRADDVLCRFGGEEFAVGLPGASAEEAMAYASRVATSLAAAGSSRVAP